MQIMLLLPILLPIAFGIYLLTAGQAQKDRLKPLSLAVVSTVSVLVWLLLFIYPDTTLRLFTYSSAINFGLRPDGLGKIFAGMVAVLWPVALAYAFVYLKHDEKQWQYYGFYVMTYGVVLGIAFSANAITMYVFYELLTFITLPLIIHTGTREARRAGRTYLYYSLSGSSLALAGIIIMMMEAGHCEFTAGGIFAASNELLGIAYLLTFFGFGVKAAVFPLCHWLPMASAAPTPTTALLHAVAVVKSGAFAVMRITFYVFSGSMLAGTWMQKAAMGFAALSIVYGSAMALKEQHFKRRFAYSTVANLSYILCGTLLCTRAGLTAAVLHFLFHSVTKIAVFFCCGALIETNGTAYVYQLNGMAKKAPKTFALFTIAGLSLIGIPGFAGFVSKYYLIASGLSFGGPVGYAAVTAIILSAVLTAGYVLSVCFRAYVRPVLPQFTDLYDSAKEPCRGFIVCCGIFALLCVVFGLFAAPIYTAVETLLGGVI